MGGIQQWCFEEKSINQRNGLKRLTQNNKIIDNTSHILKDYQKNKKKAMYNKHINKQNTSDLQLTDFNLYENILQKKEITNKKGKNKLISDSDDALPTYTFNKIKKKKKNKSSSVDNAKSLIRENSCDLTDDNTNIQNDAKKNISQIKMFMKGKFIGEGRFGKVYCGLCISTGDIITIKVYKDLSDLQKEKIIKNLDKLYKLNHKNIIRAIQTSEDDIYDETGQLNIIYESINSNNVGKLIKDYGSLDEKVIQIYIKQLLEGLKYLHGNKIYHKNLKPSNILVDTDGTIKISDYLIDGLILGNAEDMYNYLIKLEQIQFYIPPFFIKSINESMKNDNKNSNQKNCIEESFNDWQSFDLWFLGCLIIEVASGNKPWSHYNFKSNNQFFTFLESTHLIPTIPKKLSSQCKELITILLDYSLTKKSDIYDTIFNLDFFKTNVENFTKTKKSNTNLNSTEFKKNDLRASYRSGNDSEANCTQNEDSNASIFNNINNESGSQLGQVLANNKVVNILNNNNNASFSVSYTVEENNSLTQSYLNNKLNQSNISKGKVFNSININKLNNSMTEVTEAQIEQSPDPVKDNESNFKFYK